MSVNNSAKGMVNEKKFKFIFRLVLNLLPGYEDVPSCSGEMGTIFSEQLSASVTTPHLESSRLSHPESCQSRWTQPDLSRSALRTVMDLNIFGENKTFIPTVIVGVLHWISFIKWSAILTPLLQQKAWEHFLLNSPFLKKKKTFFCPQDSLKVWNELTMP